MSAFAGRFRFLSQGAGRPLRNTHASSCLRAGIARRSHAHFFCTCLPTLRCNRTLRNVAAAPRHPCVFKEISTMIARRFAERFQASTTGSMTKAVVAVLVTTLLSTGVHAADKVIPPVVPEGLDAPEGFKPFLAGQDR